MAQEDENGEKTEDPTEHKLREAHKKGDVAKSQEVNTWFVMAASTAAIAAFATMSSENLAQSMSGFFEHAHHMPADGAALQQLFAKIGLWLVVPVLLPMVMIMLAGLIGNLVQHQPLFSAEPITPKLSKISPIAGFKRLFSKQSLVNFAKGIFKIAAMSIILFIVIWPERDRLDTYIAVDLFEILPAIKILVLKLFGAALVFFTAVAAADFVYQRHTWFEKQKMSLQEVKEEHKKLEGDPHIKGRIRQIRQEKARQRMMAAVPEASVIVTNPTHYSIALKYEEGMGAPIVVAKGMDELAFRIREIAKEHDIPLVENKPLARALYATVEIDEEIPEEHYRAAAEVIRYVMDLRAKSAWKAKRPH